MKAGIKARIGFMVLGLCIIFAGVPALALADYENLPELKVRNLPTVEVLAKWEDTEVSKEKTVLSLETKNENLKVNEIFSVRILVLPENDSINVVSAVIEYDKDRVIPVRIDSDSSDFSIFLEEIIDQEKGEITISYIKPLGLNKKAVVADILFNPLSTGVSEFSFSNNSSVLANDGLGTEVLNGTKNLSISIK